MRTVILRTLGFCSVALLLAACSRSRQPMAIDDMDNANDGEDTPVNIVISRNVVTGAGDSGDETDTKFLPGCRIGVSVRGMAKYSNVQYSYPADGVQLEAVDGNIYWESRVYSMQIDAYYPYQEDGDYSAPSVEADQSTEENYYKSDALQAEGTVSDRGTMTLSNFKHRMAKVIFTFDSPVSEVRIINQRLNRNGAEDRTILPYQVSGQEWKACVLPQGNLTIRVVKEGKEYEVVFLQNAEEGKQRTYHTSAWLEVDEGENVIRKNLSAGTLNITGDDSYYISQTDAAPSSNSISIEGSPKIYISNINIASRDKSPIDIKSGTPTIILVGENVLRCTGDWLAGLHVASSANVIIKGGGSLDVTGGAGAAGIGAETASDRSCGDITIEDCTVTASAVPVYGRGGAGIGSGASASSYSPSSCGNITIRNATVNASGIGGGAGIGAGYATSSGKTSCGNITIVNSTVRAETSNVSYIVSASIGVGGVSGAESTCGDISITLKEGQSKTDFYEYDAVRTSSGKTVVWMNYGGEVIQ